MTVTVEMHGGTLQCRGPQPNNPKTRGIEIQVGFRVSATKEPRSITCDYLVVDEKGVPCCGLLNRLGIPSNPDRQARTAKEIFGLLAPSSVVWQDAGRLFEHIPQALRKNLVPTTIDQNTLPLCRLADLAVI